MTITRRSFLKTGATVATAMAVPRPLLGVLRRAGRDDVPLKDLAFRALEAARGAGAGYADVRLTHDWDRRIRPDAVEDLESMTVGVRALVDGYWGFASGPVWSPDEMVRLGREAVH